MRKRQNVLVGILLVLLFVATGAGAIFDLSQTYTIGNIAFHYPTDWLVDTSPSGDLYLATSQQTLDTLVATETVGGPPPGEFGMALVIFPQDFIELGEVSAARLLEVVLAGISNDSSLPEFGAMEQAQIGDYDIAAVRGLGDGIETIILAIAVEDVYFTVIGASAPGELDEWLPELYAVLASISLDGV